MLTNYPPQDYLTVDNKIFVGRVEEQKQFRAALAEVMEPPSREVLPYVCLLDGDGGMGKTTLVKRFCDIAQNEEPFAGQFQLLWIDWEDERKKFPSLQVGRNQINEETVFTILHAAAIRERWGRQFAAYRSALREQQESAQQVAELLEGEEGLTGFGILRAIGMDALASILRPPLPLVGNTSQGLVEAFFEAGIQVGLEQAIKLRGNIEALLKERLSPTHFEHFLNPHEQLALSIARGLNRVARRKRLIIVLDSYEVVNRVDMWMRVIIRNAGPNLMWIICDRNNLLSSRQFGNEYFKGYADEFPRRLLAHTMRPLALDNIRTYFEYCAPARPLDPETTEAISRATRGIPLAMQEAAEIWKAGASLEQITGDITVATPGSQIVQKMTDRYLQHVVVEEDRQALYALALARGDVEILRAMLHPGNDEPFDLEELLRRLERDYASVHAARAELHDDPALFLHEYLKTNVQRSSLRLKKLNQKAMEVLRARMTLLEEELPRIEDRCRDDNWVKSALDLTHYLFWVDENEAWHWLMLRFIEGMAYNSDLQNGLLQIAQSWRGNLSESGERMIKILSSAPGDEAVLLNVLNQLSERGWLEGPGEEERRAILRLRSAAQLFRHGKTQAALELCQQVESSLTEEQQTLRQQLSYAYEMIAHHLIWPTGDDDEQSQFRYDEPAELILRKVVDWFPDRQRAWFLLGMMLASAGRRGEAIETLQLTVDNDPTFVAAYNRLGELHLEEENYEAARSAFQGALQADAENAAAHAGMGHVHHGAGVIDEAITSFEKALKLDKQCASAYLGLGQVCLELGRYEEAKSALRQAVRLKYGLEEAYRALGLASWRLGESNKALVAYKLAIRENPLDAEAFCGLGDVYFRGLGQETVAIPAYRRAIALAPSLAGARIGLGDIHRASGQLEEALQEYEEAIRLAPDKAAAYNGLSHVYRALGKYAEALEAHQKAIERDPDYAVSQDNLGDVYHALNRHAEAVQAYRQALREGKGGTETYIGLGDSLYALGELDEARAAYERALAREPQSARATRGLGNVHLAGGEPQQALPLYRRALVLDPIDHYSYLRMGDAYMMLDDPRQALEAYRKAANLLPQQVDGYVGAGEALRSLGQLSKAREALEKAIALDGDHAAAHTALGAVLSAENKLLEAVAAYQRALQIDSRQAEAHKGLAAIHYRQQQLEDAYAAYLQATRVDPSDPVARRWLGQVQYDLGRYEEALQTLHAARELNEDDPELELALAHTHKALGEPEQAAAYFRRASARRPEWPAPYAGLGAVQAELGRPEQAIAAFETVLQLDPNWPIPYLQLAQQYQLTGHYNEALAAFHEARKQEGERLPVLLGIAETYAAMGDYQKAEDSYWNAADRYLHEIEPYIGLGTLFTISGKFDRAMQAYQTALDIAPGNATVQNALGRSYYVQKRYEEALAAYEAALQADPELASAYQGQAAVYHALDEHEKALDAYQKATALNADLVPDSVLGAIYSALQQSQQAIEAYEAALVANPRDVLALTGLGNEHRLLGQQHEAITAYKAAIDVDPNLELSIVNPPTMHWPLMPTSKPCLLSLIIYRPRKGWPQHSWPRVATRRQYAPSNVF